MAFTLSNLLASSLKRIGQMNTTLATSGTTATAVDTVIDPDNVPDDDSSRLGFLIVTRDAGGASAAPEGEFSQITGFNSSTNTWTFSPVMTAAIAAGDQFAYSNPQFRLQDMIQLANESLTTLGKMPLADTSLTTLATTSEYDIPVALKGNAPTRVDIQGRLSASADNQWITYHNWDWVPTVGGAVGKLILREVLPIGYKIRIWYEDVHPRVNAFSDQINERISPELAIRSFVLSIRNWQVEQDDGSDQSLQQKWNKAKQEMVEIWAEEEPEKPKKQPKLMVVEDFAIYKRFYYPPAP